MYQEKTAKEISEFLGFSEHTISKYLKLYNIPKNYKYGSGGGNW